MRTWDHYEYRIAGHYLPALINADSSGLEDDESCDLTQWERQAHEDARAAGWTVGHWSVESDESDDWGRCDVSGLFAMRATVRLMVYRDA